MVGQTNRQAAVRRATAVVEKLRQCCSGIVRVASVISPLRVKAGRVTPSHRSSRSAAIAGPVTITPPACPPTTFLYAPSNCGRGASPASVKPEPHAARDASASCGALEDVQRPLFRFAIDVRGRDLHVRHGRSAPAPPRRRRGPRRRTRRSIGPGQRPSTVAMRSITRVLRATLRTGSASGTRLLRHLGTHRGRDSGGNPISGNPGVSTRTVADSGRHTRGRGVRSIPRRRARRRWSRISQGGDPPVVGRAGRDRLRSGVLQPGALGSDKAQ